MTWRVRIPLLWALAAFSASAAERDLVRTFATQPGETVEIDTYRGGIYVTESDRAEVRVAVHLEIGANKETDAERVLRGFQLEFKSEGATVRVRARHPAEERARFIWRDNEQIEPTFRVTVPRRCDLNVKTIAGAIIVGDISGRLIARSETGDVFFRRVTGAVDAETQNGEVVVSQCNGDVTARVLHGSIRVGLVTGACRLKNLSGDISVATAEGDLDIYAEAGTATIGLPYNFAGGGRITASGGNLILKVDPRADCAIDAMTSLFARVESRLPLVVRAGAAGSRKLVGTLNGGRSSVVLRASGGNISLLPGESMFEK